MELEKRVCTLEQAKKLDELLGDDAPESLWVWAKPTIFNEWRLILKANFSEWYEDFLFAYTGDELGVLLPAHLILKKTEGYLNIWKASKGFGCSYLDVMDDRRVTEIFVVCCEAQAKADMLIHLLEQKIIDPKDLKL